MAREFDGSADYLTRSGTPVITGYPFSVSAWAKVDSFANSPAVFQFGSSSANDSRVGLYFHTTGQLYASQRNGAVVRDWITTASCSTGVWYNVIGIFLSGTVCFSYINAVSTGSSISSGNVTWPTLGRTAIGSVHRLTAIQFMDGQIAEVGLWNIDIASVSNLDNLASGYSPILVAPRNLVAYWPLHGRAGAGGDEEDWVGGELLTQVSSPALADHPRIIYPRRRSMIFVPAVVGGAPTLSDLKAASITATTVQGTYDYAF